MKKLAITVYRNDPYLELWVKYYSQFFKDLLVFNDNPLDDTSGELMKLKELYDFRVEDIRSKRDISDKFIWLTTQTRNWQEYYLQMYEVVMFTGCDEFIVPLKNTLGEYIDAMTDDFVRCTGYDVLEKEGDRPLDFNAKILQQRTTWSSNPPFNKPLITKIPLSHVEGWHCLQGEGIGVPAGDPDLALVHLKRADSQIHKTRYDNFKFGDHEPEFEQEMFHQLDAQAVPIPEEWRKRF